MNARKEIKQLKNGFAPVMRLFAQNCIRLVIIKFFSN